MPGTPGIVRARCNAFPSMIMQALANQQHQSSDSTCAVDVGQIHAKLRVQAKAVQVARGGVPLPYGSATSPPTLSSRLTTTAIAKAFHSLRSQPPSSAAATRSLNVLL